MWTGRPGVLRFMGSQRVGHDWATELNWTELNKCVWSQLLFFEYVCRHRNQYHCIHLTDRGGGKDYSEKYRSIQSNKWHGRYFGCEIIRPDNPAKLYPLNVYITYALSNSSACKCHIPFLSFIMSSSYFQHGWFIWREVITDIINRQREINILPSHKTISYGFTCPYALKLSPWSSVAFLAPWNIFVQSWTFLPCPEHNLPNCSHVLYSMYVLSIWVLWLKAALKIRNFWYLCSLLSIYLSQSSSYPQPDFLPVLLKSIPPCPRSNFSLFIAADLRGTEAVWWANYNPFNRWVWLTKWISNGQVDWRGHFWAREPFQYTTSNPYPICH